MTQPSLLDLPEARRKVQKAVPQSSVVTSTFVGTVRPSLPPLTSPRDTTSRASEKV